MKKLAAILITIALISVIIGSCMQGETRVSLRFKFEPGLLLKYKQTATRSYKVLEADTVVSKDAVKYDISAEFQFNRFVDDTTYEYLERGTWDYERPNKDDSTKVDTINYSSETVIRMLPNGKIVGAEFEEKKKDRDIAYVMSYYEQGMPVFPTGEKPIGYSWTQTTKVVMPEETTEASMTYTLKSEVRHAGYDCAVLEYVGNMILPIEANPDDSIPRSGIDRINLKGVMYFAHKEGMVVEQKESWEVDGDRRKIKDGKTIEYKVLTQYNTTFWLISREIMP